MDFITGFLTSILYQPFFNLLVGFYALLERIPGVVPDMGIAVILLTLVIRLLLLPLSIASTRSRKERHQIQQAMIEAQASPSPEVARKQVKKIVGSNRRVFISEGVNFLIQLAILFILYRIFTSGLEGDDLPLVYSFMPVFTFPFNMNFLGLFDLTKPNFTLNLFQSLTILAVEVVNIIDSPFPTSRADFVRYIIILPVVSFLLFAFLPAGKKVFIITTLWFSFFFILTNILTRYFADLFEKVDKKVEDAVVKKVASEPDNAKEPAIE